MSPDVLDIDDIVLTYYKLEKMKENQNLGLSSAPKVGLRGMTEAGLATIKERESKARSALIDLVNEYFNGLNLSDEYQVAFATTFVAEASKDEGLRQSAAANTKDDFAHSKMARNGLATMLWSYGSDTNELLDFVRKMPADKFMSLMLDLGLYERLRDETTDEDGGAQLTVV